MQLHIWEAKQIAATERISNNRAIGTSDNKDSTEAEPYSIDFIESKTIDSNITDNTDSVETETYPSETIESKTIDYNPDSIDFI